MSNGAGLDRSDRLQRVVRVCCHFMRNLAYYRVGQRHPVGWQEAPFKGTAPFWRTANSNFVDICVFEWCKLFGDKETANNPDKHGWRQIVTDKAGFETALLAHLGKSKAEFDSYRDEMRFYRDKFLGHLDSEKKMQIPCFDTAKAAVEFYHTYVANTEARPGDLDGLPDWTTRLPEYYRDRESEAARVYPI